MTQLRRDFQGRGEVQTLSRARVQPMRDGVQFALRVARQVRPLGQVLAQQPIRIFVGATLPGAIRIGKEDPDRQSLRQARVLGPLVPSIIRQGFPQQGGHMPEFFCKALSALVASVPSILARMIRRVVRSTRVSRLPTHCGLPC